MIASGEAVRAADLAKTPLFDRVVPDNLLSASQAFAAEVVEKKLPAKRFREMRVQYPNHEAFLGFARNMVKAKAGPFPAPMACLDAIEQSVTAPDYETGKRKEREHAR